MPAASGFSCVFVNLSSRAKSLLVLSSFVCLLHQHRLFVTEPAEPILLPSASFHSVTTYLLAQTEASPELRAVDAICPALHALHHLRGQEWRPYREGMVMKSEPGM